MAPNLPFPIERSRSHSIVPHKDVLHPEVAVQERHGRAGAPRPHRGPADLNPVELFDCTRERQPTGSIQREAG